MHDFGHAWVGIDSMGWGHRMCLYSGFGDMEHNE